MEPVPFRGIEMGFGFGEKVLVILHGLPVLDHKVYILVVFVLCGWAQTLFHYKGRVW